MIFAFMIIIKKSPQKYMYGHMYIFVIYFFPQAIYK